MDLFNCASLSPIWLPGSDATERIALATVRAGGLGLLDTDFCPAHAVPEATATIRRLLAALPAPPPTDDVDAVVGLRLATGQRHTHAPLLQALAACPHHLVLCGWDAATLAARLIDLAAPNRHIWLEVGAVADTARLDREQMPDFAGWIARGAECGGRCGHESAFILCQHLARLDRPFWVCGGIGLHTAAACRAAGAAGVIVDDALLLTRESPLSPRQRVLLAQVGNQDTTVVSSPVAGGGDEAGVKHKTGEGAQGNEESERVVRYRIVNRPGFAAARRLTGRPYGGGDAGAVRIGWGDPEQEAWPLGESAGWAASVAQRFGTAGRTIQAILQASKDHLPAAVAAASLAPDAPLARLHGTRYPIVQGPMTRVSDRPEFAAAVAESGALPLLALAQLPGSEARTLLHATAALLAGRPWGVGILGFLPPDLRGEQMAAIAAVRPPFALIAGGRPDQAAPLEELGIPTYLHVPTPDLLRIFLAQGTRRFVFEGAECGGHCGPLSAFTLWESMVDLLLSEVQGSVLAQVQILFAGGIHDAQSAAMLATLAAPLARRGAAVGVLMGTAYLFTAEAVTSGAIVSSMQQHALACRATVTLETGPGHLIRCARTPFTAFFAETRARLRAAGQSEAGQSEAGQSEAGQSEAGQSEAGQSEAGQSEAEISKVLEALLLGRLRIAAKGLARDENGLHRVDESDQSAQGMYMMGEVAALRNAEKLDGKDGAVLTTCADLHRAVAEESMRLVEERAAATAPRHARPAPAPASVAIVGAGCLLPGAQNPETLWRNLLDMVETTREIPIERWDWRLFYDPDKSAPDKIYAKWGGFIDPLPFDPLHYGIPPKSLPSISVAQLLALEVTRRALQDAGYGDTIEDETLRSGTAVFFGAGNTADMEQLYIMRSTLPLVVPYLADSTAGADLLGRLPVWTEESYPGILANVIAGRVANRFDLGGPNLTLDAACASSLAALDMALRELESGRSDLVLAGGIEFEQTPQAYMAFSKTQALSSTGRARVFDQSGDGIVISEGAIVLVLKRLADAERDGDRIYAVIQSVAGSSDGKGFGLTAPKPAGQRRAFDRAHARAGSDPAAMQLYEAHATGTAVGDRSELEMIAGALRAVGAQPGACAIGSAKSLLGHTRSTAGVLGVLKAALALYHRVLPPHAGVETPLAALTAADSPLYLLDQALPWLPQRDWAPAPGETEAAHFCPRPHHAGVSAFGFGGTNFHAVLEEYRDTPGRQDAYGAAQWPCELIVITAPDVAGIQHSLAQLTHGLDAVEASSRMRHAAYHLRDLAYTCAVAANHAHACRLALVVRSLEELRQQVVACQASLAQGVPLPAGVFSTTDSISSAVGRAIGEREGAMQLASMLPETEAQETGSGEVAFLFPGQGSQYPGMGAELALYFVELRDALAQAAACCTDQPDRWVRLVLPPAAFSEDERRAQVRRLAATDVAQPAIAAISAGLLDLATRVGLSPTRVAGHSFGEFVALHAAGVIDRASLLRLAVTRGRIMANLSKGEDAHGAREAGTMAVAFMPRAALASYLATFPAVTVANINAPDQCALSGSAAALAQISQRLQADGHVVHALPVAAAFHSPLMQPARAPFAAFVADQIEINAPVIPVHANLDGAPYPDAPQQIRTRWVEHLENCVDFVAQVEHMYAAGVRTFVEVGPGRVLTGLVHRILHDRPHRAVAFDGAGRSSQSRLAGWLAVMAELYVAGLSLRLEAIFCGRAVRWIELDRLPAAAAPAPGWLIDGGRIWPAGAESHNPGELPLLTLESTQAALAASNLTAGIPATAGFAPAPEGTISAVYREYQQTMREFLAQQERLMAQILGGEEQHSTEGSIAAARGAVPAPAAMGFQETPRLLEMPAPLSGTAQEKAAASLPRAIHENQAGQAVPDRAELTRRLVAMVSERTGYPVDMLDPSKDLEAELGVDSIKRIEILGRLPTILPADVARQVQSQLDRLTGLKSLDRLVDALMREIDAMPSVPKREIDLAITTLSETPPSPSQTLSREPDANEGGEADSTCPRYLMRSIACPLRSGDLEQSLSGRFDGLVIVTEDLLGVGRTVCELLEQQGARAFLLRRQDLLDPEGFERRVLSLIYIHGSLRGVVHLAALGMRAESDSLDAWHAATTLTTKSFFRLLQLCALGFESATEPVQILAALQLDGEWGRTAPSAGTAAAGSAHGMLRTLESEYPKVLSKVVDFDKTFAPAVMARHIVNELLADDGVYEIGYHGGQRSQFWAVRAPLDTAAPANDWCPQPGWVVLVTGGARGITAEICRELARPGVHLIVVGRSPEPPAAMAAEPGESPDIDVAAIRARLIHTMREQGIERTPAEIESETRALQREFERRRNLDALAAAGAHVEYHAVDVRSDAVFGALIDDLYQRFGRIDAVVHGAGIIEDRQFEEKTIASFDRVFDTKADSAYILSQRLRPDGLKWVVFFSSVAGRFGNQGQIDYAAANEVVNRLACQLNTKLPATRVLSINWGPWRGAGMATQGIQRQFVVKGITPIEPTDGRRFFVDELAYGQKGDVEIIAGEGPWKVDSSQQLRAALELGAIFLSIRAAASGSNDLSRLGR